MTSIAALRIREALPSEADELSGLVMRSKAHWGYDDAFLASVEEELRVRPDRIARGRCWVAEVDGRPVGFCSVDGEPPEGELGMLFVDPDRIGTGVGRRLLAHAVEAAATAGFVALEIDADPGAEPFYVRAGAVRVGLRPSGSIPGRMLPHLRLRLPLPLG